MAHSFADFRNRYNLTPSRTAAMHSALVRLTGIFHLIRAAGPHRFDFADRLIPDHLLCAHFPAALPIATHRARPTPRAHRSCPADFGLCGPANLGQSSAVPRRFSRQETDRLNRAAAYKAARPTQRVTQKSDPDRDNDPSRSDLEP
jgi:hypothetical protein